MQDLFVKWEDPARARISALRNGLATELETLGNSDRVSSGTLSRLVIYATGSLARLEASEHSDLDAFFYIDGCSSLPVDPVDGIEIFHSVIRIASSCEFPDFSNGGEFLHFQYKDDVIKHLGSRQDDYINALTSRMLLMLESCHLYNEALYKNIKSDVINRYFIDFHGHREDFKPVFLINDILRFWRTLCINYEHRREWASTDPIKRAKGHLNNLKLRFSRLLICYSFIVAVMAVGPGIQVNDVNQISEMTPLQRIRGLNQTHQLQGEIERAISEYAWFLERMSSSKAIVLEWILDDKERAAAFAHGEEFINSMYDIVSKVAASNGYSRYLVI